MRNRSHVVFPRRKVPSNLLEKVFPPPFFLSYVLKFSPKANNPTNPSRVSATGRTMSGDDKAKAGNTSGPGDPLPPD